MKKEDLWAVYSFYKWHKNNSVICGWRGEGLGWSVNEDDGIYEKPFKMLELYIDYTGRFEWLYSHCKYQT